MWGRNARPRIVSPSLGTSISDVPRTWSICRTSWQRVGDARVGLGLMDVEIARPVHLGGPGNGDASGLQGLIGPRHG